MQPKHQFFVDLDQETVKRVSVRHLDQDRFLIETCLQLNHGWEAEAQEVEIRGKAALARRLVDEGVPPQKIREDLKVDTRSLRRKGVIEAIALGSWLAIGLGVAWFVGWL
jgi:hypothetical protein